MTTTTEREEINNNYNCIDSGIGGSGGSSSGDQRSSPPSETIKNYSELISPQINLNKNLTTFSTSAAAPSSSFSSSFSSTPGMFANVVGYARSRLFKNANDGLLMPGEKDEQSPFHHSSLNLTKQKFLNQQNCCQSAQTTPFKKVESLTTTNEEKNKNFLNKNNNNKSCPVQRKQFNLSSKLQKEENFCSFSSPLDNWGVKGGQKSEFSSSIGSRESVLIENSSRASSRQGEYFKSIKENKKEEQEHWQLFAVSLHKANQSGFGIAISGSSSNNDQSNGGIFISDVISNGPAFGLLQIGDKIISCNGYPLEHANYSSAVTVMKEAQQLNMIVKRRVPVPFVEFEQRTLKFTLSKSRKKDDFGIVLGCRFYIKEILNPKLAEKEPGLKEGDSVLRINGQSLDGVSLEEATRLLQRSREKLSLVVQRDVRRNGGNCGTNNNRWPSQTTVYERLGSVQATPRHSPTPAHYGFPPPQQQQQQQIEGGQYISGRKGSSSADYSPGYKRYSDPMTSSLRTDFYQPNNNVYSFPPQQGIYSSSTPQKQMQQTFVQMQNNGKPIPTTLTNETIETNQQQQQNNNNNYMCQSSPYIQNNQHSSLQQQPSPHPQQRFLNNNNNNSVVPSIQTRAQSLTPSSIQSLPVTGGNLNNIINHNSLQRPTPPIEQQQQQLIITQQQQQISSNGKYINNSTRSINNSSINSQIKQTPIIKTISFQKGPSGLGIRVIGGNQVGIFVSAVQQQSHADQHGICVGDRIHAVNGVSIAGLTREEAFDVLLSLGEQQISLAVEHAPEEFAQVKAGKFGDSFYIRSHFAYNRSTTSRGVASQLGNQQQPIELSIRAGDIFHVTDTLFGGSLGYWQATKIYSAEQQNSSSSSSESTASCTPATTNTGIIPHAKVAEQLLRIYRQTNNNNTMNGNNSTDQGNNGGGTLTRSLFRKKLSFSSRKLFGGGGGSTAENLDEVLSGAGSITNSFSEIVPPAYERVALKRPAFHRPVVLYGPLADVARQMLLTQSSMRFGAPLPSTSSITSGTGADPLVSSLSVSPIPERGGISSNILGCIRLCAVDKIMASQKHCVLCVNPASVERLQLAQYAPIVVLIDVESKTRVRELRAKAGATTQSARKLVEQAQKLKRQYSHLLTATLDATKEDQWFEALRALIFHLQERRVWMPEFQLEQPLDEMILFPMHPPGTPTSDGDKSDYSTFEPQQQQQQTLINGTFFKTNISDLKTFPQSQQQQQTIVIQNNQQTNEMNNSINLRH